jgi:hypothetical protein
MDWLNKYPAEQRIVSARNDLLPLNISDITSLYEPNHGRAGCLEALPSESQAVTTSTPNVPTIVTGFFDLGRENWASQVGGNHIAPWVSGVDVPELFARSNQLYFNWFAYLAAIKNPMIIFTEEHFCPFVHAARAAHGLQDQTRIVACKSPFRTSTPLDHAIARTRRGIARPEFGVFVARPYAQSTGIRITL